MPAKFNGTVVVWADPLGRAVLTQPASQQALQSLLDRGVAVVAADLFRTGPDAANNPLARGGKYAGYTFSGYYYGYNPTVLANRVNDLHALLALQSSDSRVVGEVKSVRLLATGKAGPWALLAQATGNYITTLDRAAIDLHYFDFDQVHDPADEMMLPGATKYGGLPAFATLCTTGKIALWNVPQSWKPNSRGPTPALLVQEGDADLSQMIAWLLGSD